MDKHLKNMLKPKRSKKKNQTTDLPTFDIHGRVIDPGREKRKKKTAIGITAAAVLAGAVYLPQFVIPGHTSSSEEVTVSLDLTQVKANTDLLRNSQKKDFDDDGLDNATELASGSSPWFADTDGDGLSDAYEVTVLDSNPAVADTTMLDLRKKNDEKNGDSLTSPYEVHNVRLWAEDYESKAYGSVIETLSGYHFCNFNGYAQFAACLDGYAYKVADGKRTLLPYREKENVWRVSADDYVEVYDQKLEEVIDTSLAGHHFYLAENPVTKILSVILPDKGWITMEEKTKMDVDGTSKMSTTADIEAPYYSRDNTVRFTANTNTLQDLNYVYDKIDQNSCVAVSLYNSKEGEYIGIIYGYTYDGNLLLADPDTLKEIGEIRITQMSAPYMDQSGNLKYQSYFDFTAFGFDSKAGDRISFFASNGTSASTTLGDSLETDDGDDNETTTPTPTPTPTATPTATPTESATSFTQETVIPGDVSMAGGEAAPEPVQTEEPQQEVQPEVQQEIQPEEQPVQEEPQPEPAQ